MFNEGCLRWLKQLDQISPIFPVITIANAIPFIIIFILNNTEFQFQIQVDKMSAHIWAQLNWAMSMSN